MENPSGRLLVVLTGPTAVGKTALSLSLARRLETEIVSADSRQCYHGLRIGTAQPTAAECAAVPHHLIDFLPLSSRYSAGAYAADALPLLEQLWQRGPYALLAGGSAFYIQAVCEGLVPMPPVSPAVTASLEARLQVAGLAPLVAELARLDPVCHASIDRKNPKRILRALALCHTTGVPYSQLLKSAPPISRPFHTIKIVLSRPREELYERIDRRVDQMVAEGLLEEAERLYGARHLPGMQTIGYPELFAWMEGRCSLEEALQQIKTATRHYAKRQLSWWRRDPAIGCYHPDQEEDILAAIRKAAGQASTGLLL